MSPARPPRSNGPGADMGGDLCATAVQRIRLENLNPRALIAPNFRVYELSRSDIALRQGIDNDFESAAALHAAIHLAREVLQPLRDNYGRFSPNSVYRSQALERALKHKPSAWFSTSQHTRGQACDVEIPGVSTLALAQWAAEHLPFDQIICECYDPRRGPDSGWVHISLRPPGAGENRRNLLSYVRQAGGHMAYVSGLLPQGA